MSLQAEAIGKIPEQTKRIAEAAFPRGNVYIKMRDELGTFYEDDDFTDLFPPRGQPAHRPWRLALVLVLQFAEGLSDRQAADAVRARIDWKYALGLELDDPGFDYSILSEFRDRLLKGSAEERLLDKMLERFKEKGYLKARGKQRTDSTHVLQAVRQVNRLELLGETLRAALNTLAESVPQWLREQVSAAWFQRYGRRVEQYRLPQSESERKAYAGVIGEDGFGLLEAVERQDAPPGLPELTALATLRQVWEQQFVREAGKVRLRTGKELAPSGERIHSPYDPEAHYGNKGAVEWMGYKVHFTETCDADQVHLITQVETSSAVVPDVAAGEPILSALEEKDLLPEQYLVDSGYVDIEWFIKSKSERGVSVVGPVRPDPHWQARATDGFDGRRFAIDWDHQQIRCPGGQTTRNWSSVKSKGEGWYQVRFSPSQCRPCGLQQQCTKSAYGRALLLRPRAQHEALRRAREQQQSKEWKKQYDQRAGIEGTLSQGIRGFGLRQARYIGQAKTHLQNVLTAAAINVSRIISWLDETPHAKTRTSHFARLAEATG